MMSRSQFEKDILRMFGQVVARDVNKKKITPEAAFKSELKMDSLGLISLVHLIEEAFHIDLFSQTEKLAEAEFVREIVDIAFRVYTEESGAGGS